MSNIDKLFDFAYFPRYDKAIEYLAENLADKETWDFGNVEVKKYSILKNYLDYTFRKLYSESQILFSIGNKYACFNSGLVTQNLEEIFVFFEKNKNPQISLDWYFKAFIKESDDRLLRNFSAPLPPRANYFQKPEDLIFNASLDIIPDLDHIINDNLDRFPPSLQQNKDKLRRTLSGAINEVKKRVKTNYKIAIPQYFKNEIQLLLPLNLTETSNNPDLALVIYKSGNHYSGKTCLTLKMAYTNARLIVKPQSDWLKTD